jgi:hypothetical protein
VRFPPKPIFSGFLVFTIVPLYGLPMKPVTSLFRFGFLRATQL